MIQIQIKVGKLLPEGRILNTTEQWKALDDIIWDGYSEWNANFHKLKDGKTKMLKRNIDYDHVTKYHNTIHLDDIIVPEGYLVTGRFLFLITTLFLLMILIIYLGVRFAHGLGGSNTGNYQPFILEVQATPFDIVTGKLTFSKIYPPTWINARTMTPRPPIYNNQRYC